MKTLCALCNNEIDVMVVEGCENEFMYPCTKCTQAVRQKAFNDGLKCSDTGVKIEYGVESNPI